MIKNKELSTQNVGSQFTVLRHENKEHLPFFSNTENPLIGVSRRKIIESELCYGQLVVFFSQKTTRIIRNILESIFIKGENLITEVSSIAELYSGRLFLPFTASEEKVELKVRWYGGNFFYYIKKFNIIDFYTKKQSNTDLTFNVVRKPQNNYLVTSGGKGKKNVEVLFTAVSDPMLSKYKNAFWFLLNRGKENKIEYTESLAQISFEKMVPYSSRSISGEKGMSITESFITDIHFSDPIIHERLNLNYTEKEPLFSINIHNQKTEKDESEVLKQEYQEKASFYLKPAQVQKNSNISELNQFIFENILETQSILTNRKEEM